MDRSNRVGEDPVVAEVRAIRQRIWREAGGNIPGLLKWLDEHVPVARQQRRPAGRRKRSRPTRRQAHGKGQSR
jgi:hypothetical protein